VEDGRQIEAVSAPEQSDKVVRLPRDWLGPREDLVPFGPSTPPPAESELDGFAPNDFWGERAAAIHSVVQGPADDPTATAPASDPAPSIRKGRLGRWHVAAAVLVAIAAAGAVPLLFGGSPNHVTRGAGLNIAAIVSQGVARILKSGPPRIVERSASPRPVRHVRHRSPRPKAPRPRPQHHSAPASASTYVTHTSPPSPQPTYRPIVTSPAPRIVTTRPPAASKASSGANVRPTGQTGALGPVQSPNG
jgi:hypothetical protein